MEDAVFVARTRSPVSAALMRASSEANYSFIAREGHICAWSAATNESL
jgi:hypothetical protein